ncbi:hypothetical protein AB0N29_11645 [Nocardioides sp. NPDC092400]|uniref:hypothetical protein n=1 Tax=Nocardioides sp. NPDC092400 TaxID=3155196 RepID=UPI003436B317
MSRSARLAALALLLVGTTATAAPAATAAPGGPTSPAATERTATERTVTERTVTVRGDCVRHGRVVLRQDVGPETTTVTVRARGIANGRWRGEHLLEVGVDDTNDTRVSVRARRHGFATTFEVDGSGIGGVLDLGAPSGGACSVAYSEADDLVVVGDRRTDVFVATPGPRRRLTRAHVHCRPGTRWSLAVEASDEDGGYGFGGSAVPCRRGSVVARDLTTGKRASLPDTLEVVAERTGGRTLRLRYDATEHAAAEATAPVAG